jgi:hypothetical protein
MSAFANAGQVHIILGQSAFPGNTTVQRLEGSHLQDIQVLNTTWTLASLIVELNGTVLAVLSSNSGTSVLQWQPASSRFESIQSLPPSSSSCYGVVGGFSYLVLGDASGASVLTWNQTTYRFQAGQRITTAASVRSVTFMTAAGVGAVPTELLFVGLYASAPSMLLVWQPTYGFVFRSSVAASFVTSSRSFVSGGVSVLIVCNYYGPSASVYAWDASTQQLLLQQQIKTGSSTNGVAVTSRSGSTLAIFTDYSSSSVPIYTWSSHHRAFSATASLPAAASISLLTIPGSDLVAISTTSTTILYQIHVYKSKLVSQGVVVAIVLSSLTVCLAALWLVRRHITHAATIHMKHRRSVSYQVMNTHE